MRADLRDPVVLKIFWQRLISVTDEQSAALIRTAFTPMVRDTEDLSAGVFDRRGHMIAQSVTGTPGHINSMATGMKHFLEAYPPHTLDTGDVLITTIHGSTSGQLNDLTVATPVFAGDRLVASSPHLPRHRYRRSAAIADAEMCTRKACMCPF